MLILQILIMYIYTVYWLYYFLWSCIFLQIKKTKIESHWQDQYVLTLAPNVNGPARVIKQNLFPKRDVVTFNLPKTERK